MISYFKKKKYTFNIWFLTEITIFSPCKKATYITTDISIDLPKFQDPELLGPPPPPPSICRVILKQTNSDQKRCRLTGGAGDGVGGAVSLQEVTAGPSEPPSVGPRSGVHLGTTVEPLTHFFHAEVLLGAKRRGEEIGARTVLHTNLSAEQRAWSSHACWYMGLWHDVSSGTLQVWANPPASALAVGCQPEKKYLGTRIISGNKSRRRWVR